MTADARTQIEEALAEAVAAGHVSEADAAELLAEDARVSAAIGEGRCPACGRRALTRRLDPRQAGPTFGHGSWFNYRCPCGFALDRAEEPS